MNRKGISPLIAAVLLIAFTIAVAGLAGPWFSEIMQDAQSGTDEDLDTVTSAGDVRLEVMSVDFNSGTGTYTVSIRNSGTSAGENFTATITGNNQPVQKQVDTKLEAGEIHTFTISSSHSSKADSLTFQSRSRPVKADYDLSDAEPTSVLSTKVYTISSYSDWSNGQFNGTTAYKPKFQDQLSIGYQNGSSSDNLVGFWRLDGNSGSVIDYSGNNNDGSTSNFDGDERGKTGIFSTSSFNLDGTSDYVEIGDVSALKTFPLSMSLWVNVENFPSNGAESVVSSGAVSSDQGADLLVMSDNSVAFDALNSAGEGDPKQNVKQSISENVWIHVVGVWSGDLNDDLKLYVNGSLKDSYSAGSWSLDSTTSPVRFGRHGHTDGGYFDGRIDAIQIYDKALSSSEIKKIYRYGRPAKANYNSTIEPSGSGHDWQDFEVTVSDIPSGTSVSANFTVLDSSNNVKDFNYEQELSEGEQNISVSGLPDSDKARIALNGSTSDVTKSWNITETQIYYK